MEQVNLDGNPGAPFQIGVIVKETVDGGVVVAEIQEGAPYWINYFIIQGTLDDGTTPFEGFRNVLDDESWVFFDDGALVSSEVTVASFPVPTLISSYDVDFSKRYPYGHPHQPSGDNRFCLGLEECYTGFEFKYNPPPRLIDVQVTSPEQPYTTGNKIRLAARYSEDIELAGVTEESASPTLTFTIGDSQITRTAEYVEVEDSLPNVLNFEYAVQEQDGGNTGVRTLSSVLTLPSDASIKDAHDNPLEDGGKQQRASSRVYDISFVTGLGGSGGRGSISRIEPTIRGVSLRSDEMVRLAIDVYGLQDIVNNDLVDDVAVDWDDGNAGGSFEGTGNRVLYTAPSVPGTYKITVMVPDSVCQEDLDTDDTECEASFEITVKRPAALQPTDVAPGQPGRRDTDDPQRPVRHQLRSLHASRRRQIRQRRGLQHHRAVRRCAERRDHRRAHGGKPGPASNVGMTHQRYTLGGNSYDIHVVDATGAVVENYVLDDPAEGLRAAAGRAAFEHQQDRDDRDGC